MDMTFEGEFSQLQADMVSVCLEYCERNCDCVYIHIVTGADTVSSDFFFLIDGTLRRKGRLNGVDSISPLRQKEALKIILTDAKAAVAVCEKYKRAVPSEIKIAYNVKSGAAECNYGYDNVENKNSRELTEQWFHYIESGNEVNK